MAHIYMPINITNEGWKLRYVTINDSFQLYYLPENYQEEKDLSQQHPDRVGKLKDILLKECDGDLKYGHEDIQQIGFDR